MPLDESEYGDNVVAPVGDLDDEDEVVAEVRHKVSALGYAKGNQPDEPPAGGEGDDEEDDK
jgi:hypothetical protein